VLLGLAFAALVFAKERGVARLALAAGARSRALIPVPGRSLIAGSLFGAALFLGAELEEPTLAGAALLFSLAFAALRSPSFGRELRGPGRWLPLRDEDAFATKRVAIPASWLDAGHRRGLLVFALLLLLAVAIAWRELPRSAYRALLELVLASGALPIFFTGAASDFVRDRVAPSQKFLRRLAAGLRPNAAFGGRLGAHARRP
jgi:hypothetical protein